MLISDFRIALLSGLSLTPLKRPFSFPNPVSAEFLNETDAGEDDAVYYFPTNSGFACWLCFLCVGGEEDNVLWIAMAGTHQIWALFLADGKLPKGG